jgi:hypothetical protein
MQNQDVPRSLGNCLLGCERVKLMTAQEEGRCLIQDAVMTRVRDWCFLESFWRVADAVVLGPFPKVPIGDRWAVRRPTCGSVSQVLCESSDDERGPHSPWADTLWLLSHPPAI